MKTLRYLKLRESDEDTYLKLNIDTRFGFYSFILVYQSCRAFRAGCKIHARRYKLRKCDSRDRVWTLFAPRDLKTKKNAYHESLFLSFSPSLFHIPHADRSIRLSSTHLVKVYREVSAEFPGCHRPREKFNMRFASNLFAHERVRECEKVIRRVRVRMIRRHEVRKSWNWRILYAKLRETILICCRCELEMSL